MSVELLPPINKVWGKVIFPPSRGHSVHGGDGERGFGEGVCGRHPLDPEADTPSPRGRPSPVETATEAGGTHPTGMHSCVY